MEQRRFLNFLILSMAVGYIWFTFVVPSLFPVPQRAQGPADAMRPVNVVAVPNPAPNFNREEGDKQEVPNVPVAPKAVEHPVQTVLLGPADPDKDKNGVAREKLDEFFIAANTTSEGAAIDYVELTDKERYPAFGRRGDRVRIIGNDEKSKLKTFSLQIPEIDKQLGAKSLDRVSWEVVPEKDPADASRAVTYRFTSPDGQWEVLKRFELKQLTHAELQQSDIRKTLAEGYEIKLKITVRNLSDQQHELSYALLGPIGVPLEDADNTSKYRDLRMGFIRDDGGVDESKQSASEIVKKFKNKKLDKWTRKVKYIGVDVLYFAALILPAPDQIESSNPLLVSENAKKPEFSDVSVELASVNLKVPAHDAVTQEYTMYAGPKRKELISQLSAIAVMDYGWFDTICRGMVWLLNTFHSLGLNYGIAIICLTVLVRTLLMPISKHQAANAAKMKDLQPKLMEKQKELEAKYGKNTEEYMKAAQELSKEQLGLMMSGCLPMFLQLPIFIALYRAIGSSVDLRMEPFLWFENLASPDALFKLPFVVPWFGWTDFNLLPCISTGLIYFSQKMTAPPPMNEEQAQQQKMMNFMMIFMGAMFFRVPSGLCLYFIATNIWSMTERQIFEYFKKKRLVDEPPVVTIRPAPTSPTVPASDKPSALGTFWSRLQEAADDQRSSTRQLESGPSRDDRNDKKKKKR